MQQTCSLSVGRGGRSLRSGDGRGRGWPRRDPAVRHGRVPDPLERAHHDLFGDGLSRHGDCSLPPSALTIAWNQGSSGGTALLAFDPAGPGVACSAGSLRTRLELAFVPLKDASGGYAYHMRSHSNRIVLTGGYRYHVQGQDEAWMNSVTGSVDGVAISVSEAYRASLVTHTTTEIKRVQ